MAYFFTFLFFVSIVALVVGILKPKLVVKWKDTPTRGDVFKSYFSLGFLSLIMVGFLAPNIQKKSQLNNEKHTQQVMDKTSKPQNIIQEKPKTNPKQIMFNEDKKEILKLLNSSFSDMKRTEQSFKIFQEYLTNNDIYSAIKSAQRNKRNILELTYKSYPDDVKDDEIEDIVDKYIHSLHNSYLYLQIYYKDFLEYVDNQKPTLAVKVKEDLQYYQIAVTQALAPAFSLANKYNLAYDKMTETWREKKYIEQDEKERNKKQAIQKKKKPFINAKKYKKNSPKYIIAKFMTAWQYKDYNEMAKYTQKSWRNRQSSPEGDLLNTFDDKTLTGAKIIKVGKSTSSLIKTTIEIKYIAWDKKEKVAKIHPNIIKEDGELGINPISAIRED